MMCREKPKCFFKAAWKGRKEEDILKLHLCGKGNEDD